MLLTAIASVASWDWCLGAQISWPVQSLSHRTLLPSVILRKSSFKWDDTRDYICSWELINSLFFLIFVFTSIVQFIDEAKACSSRSAAKYCLYVRMRCPGRQSTRFNRRRIFLVSKAFPINADFGLFRQRWNRRQQLLVSFPATGALSITTECSQETPDHVPAFIRYQLGFALVSPIGKGPAIISINFFVFFFLPPASSPLISSYLVVALGVLCILAPTAPRVLAGGSLSLCGDGTSYFLIDKWDAFHVLLL